ncbi:probable serine/threonine-protein kinase dyrk2 isoform X2 [Cryptotermes secundus]|uniref:probable serine/threonine-protein kinase dyrk2 isoform X2 n=1 Tax=Cryptotermes secundus TaxID=105785 RepID=UPI000CD7AFDD|nr:probable serine/threonine-protein kinase dyrk2 isoform X2 [Cryptotermes secundus]
MSGRSPGVRGGPGPPAGGARCLFILQRCLAIQLQKVALLSEQRKPSRDHEGPEYWMYDSGYLLFQGFLEANLKCFWNASLLEAMRLLEFQGYVAPGVLLVTASACALEVVRGAWARNVLKPPNNYVIAVVGDVEDCLVQPLPQGQFTPLPEALCWVILDLTSSGQAAVLERIRSALQVAFPDIQRPSQEIVYDALAKLTTERKVYQTSQGYFVVTPEKRRRDSSSHQRRHSRTVASDDSRPMLMSTEEALAYVHGEMQTIRDGAVTHQAVQTNLADVICGEKLSLLSRLFRRSGRKQRGSSAPPAALATFSAQFPPAEWFNQRVVHLHSVGTQTVSSMASQHSAHDSRRPSQGSIPLWTDEDGTSSRAATLPRRHRRHASGDSATCSIVTNATPVSNHTSNITPHSSRRQRSPSSQSSTLPRRSTSSNSKSDPLSRTASRSSVLPQSLGQNPSPCKTSATTISSNEKPNHQSGPSKVPSQISVITPGSTPSRSSLSVHQNSNISPIQSSTISKATPTSSPNRSLSGGPSSSSSLNKSLPGTCGSNKSPSNNVATPTVKSNNSSRNLGSYSLIKNSAAGNSLDTKGDNQVSPQKNTSSSSSPVGNKSSITLQVSTTNRTSPPSSSGYSSQCQSSNGRASVLSSASSAVVPPFQDLTSRRNVTVMAGSPNDHTTTTTATINSGPNTKIYVQQQNSPIRSVITFENGIKHNTNSLPNKDILILNGFSSHADGKSSSKENVSMNIGKCKGKSDHAQSKPERPKSLYSPREKIKRGGERHHESAGNRLERRKCPSLEALAAAADISSLEAATKNKHTNSLNSNNIINENIHKRPSSSSSSSLTTNGGNLVSTHHPNSHPPSTQPTCSNPTMNNTRILRSLSASPALPVRSKENLSYKNVLRNSPSTPPDTITPLNLHLEGIKNKFCSNPSSPTKSFDNFGGSYGNLYIEGMGDTDKFLSSNAQELQARDKGSEERSYECSSTDLCPYSSLSDLTVHFKSIAAQKILKGVSINSIDTLVEVNMAAAEKQNNCDVTIHTDFGMV